MRLASLALVAALAAGCSNLTPNHTRGLAAVGLATTVAGATVIADGWSCDQRGWNNGGCTHDAAELRDGAILTAAGVALLGFAIWKITGEAPEAAAPPLRPRAARRP